MDADDITTMRTAAAVAHVAGVLEVQELKPLQNAERANPKVAGGRVRVLEAIDARWTEFAIAGGTKGNSAEVVSTGEGEKKKAPPPPPMDLSPQDPWREDRWAELPQFNCRTCPYQTLEGRQAIEQHVAAAHPEVWRPYLKTREA